MWKDVENRLGYRVWWLKETRHISDTVVYAILTVLLAIYRGQRNTSLVPRPTMT